MNHIILAFWNHAQAYYHLADGRPTSEIGAYQQVLRLLRHLYGKTNTLEFGPKALKAVREQMVVKRWSRKSINRQVDRIRHMFKWAAAEEILPASIYDQLHTVLPLKRGRTAAPETPRVRPAPQERIDAIQPHVSRQVWAMIQLQLLTGARAGEIVTLRGVDLCTRDKTWTVEPQEHKTAYRELSKTIYFGPQAQAILKEFLKDRPLDAYLFSPTEAEAEHRAKKHAARKTPLSCGNRPGSCRSDSPQRHPRDRYTVDTYRRAIQRGCDLAYPPPEPLARKRVKAKRGFRWETVSEWQTRLGAEGCSALEAWQKAHRWHPHQLRHNAATYIRREFGLEMARVILGHRSISVTEIYAELDEAKAKNVIEKIG